MQRKHVHLSKPAMFMYTISSGFELFAKLCMAWSYAIGGEHIPSPSLPPPHQPPTHSPQQSNVTVNCRSHSNNGNYVLKEINGERTRGRACGFYLPVKNLVESHQALAESYRNRNPGKIRKTFFRTTPVYHQPEYLDSDSKRLFGK